MSPEDERKQGLKTPSAAHKAIAQLVDAGYLRVIITTNFDRLIEKALEEIGVTPTVISTSDQADGSLPLAHSGATVIKLHGDYRDTRIKNTESELAIYDPALDGLLDRVFDEYGIIVCGWSADWDKALRTAIERCPSRRFTTYWATRSPLSEPAKRLVEHRKAEVLKIRDANQFFEELWEKVRALADMAAPHPLSAKMAAATVKRYLVDPAARIRLRDLVHEETEKLVAELTGKAFSTQTKFESAEFNQRVAKYEALCETLLSIMLTGCYWGNREQTKLWVDCLDRVANAGENSGGSEDLLKLRHYPALFLLYGAGLASVASKNYQTFAAVLTEPRVKESYQDQKMPICSIIYPSNVMEQEVGHLLPGMVRRHTPVNDHLFGKLRAPLREYIPGDDEYQATFDRFEYLFGLVYADLNRMNANVGWFGPFGCFKWRRYYPPESSIMQTVGREIESAGANWAPLKAGLFGGDLKQAQQAKENFDSFLNSFNLH